MHGAGWQKRWVVRFAQNDNLLSFLSRTDP
jgi:hypothetical protein